VWIAPLDRLSKSEEKSMYQVYWDVPGYVLCLKLIDAVTLEEFIEIDSLITSYLSNTHTRTAIVIDITDAKHVPFPSDQIRASQAYTQHPMLKWLLVVGGNKLMRLMMLLTFNLSRASLQFIDNAEKLDSFLHLHKLKQLGDS
jgi:hypothetical protein